MTDPFSSPQKPFAGGTGPALRCIGGPRKRRLAVIVPFEIVRRERNPFYKADKPESYNNQPLRDRMVCDVLLCDGEPFYYGGNDKDIPDTQGPFPVPGVIRGYEIVKQSIVDSIRPTDVGGGVVIGYFYQQRTNSGNDAWNFGEAPEPGTPDRLRAAAIYEAYRNGQLPTHVPTDPVANPVQPAFSAPQGNGQPPAQVPYNNPMGVHQNPYAQPYGQPQQTVPTPYGPAPVQNVHPAYAQAVQQAQAIHQAPPQGSPYGSPPQAAPAAPAFDFASIIGQPAAPAAPVDMPPPGAPQNVIDAWPSLNPMQRDMVRQQVAAMAQQGAAPTYP